MPIVHVKYTKQEGIYCDTFKKGIDEWVEPYVSIDSEPSALRAHGGWTDRAICVACIQKAAEVGHLQKKHLYCVLAETIGEYEGKKAWIPAPLRYTHAVNETHARMTFFANHSRLTTKILFIGRAVGYNVADSKGEVLFA